MSDTFFQADFAGVVPASSRFSTPVANPVFAKLVRTVRAIEAHDAIEQATVWASLAGGGFFVAAMAMSVFN